MNKYIVKVVDAGGNVLRRIGAPAEYSQDYVFFTDLERAKLAALDDLFEHRQSLDVMSDCSLGDWSEGITNINPLNGQQFNKQFETWTLWDRLTNLKYYVFTKSKTGISH